MPANLKNSAVAAGLENMFSFQSQGRAMSKNVQTTTQLHLSHTLAVHGVMKSQTRLNDFTFTFHFHALEKEMATHSSVLAWRIPRMGEPGRLSSMGSHRVKDFSVVNKAEVDDFLELFRFFR